MKPLDFINSLYKFQELRHNQWKLPSELAEIQEIKLKALLRHAYDRVRYYRNLFDRAGIKPDDIGSIRELVKLPIITRKDLQALPREDIVASDLDLSCCVNLRTSGSTGMPLDIFVSVEEMAIRRLLYQRMYFENGGRLTDRELSITTPRHFGPRSWFKRPGSWKREWVSVFDDVGHQIKVFLEFRPTVIGGFTYASALKALCLEIEKKGIKRINPRIIFSTAESITAQDKGYINAVMSGEIFDFYSCNECGIVAWECKEHAGYHINSDSVILELIKGDGRKAEAGEEGDIVLTSLNSYGMPLIRYRIGDVGVPSDETCRCGRSLPLLKRISGRANDFIIAGDGNRISPFALMSTMDRMKSIHQYKIVQEGGRTLRIHLVFQDLMPESDVALRTAEVQKAYKEVLGDSMPIDIVIDKEIFNDKTGKHKRVVSRHS